MSISTVSTTKEDSRDTPIREEEEQLQPGFHSPASLCHPHWTIDPPSPHQAYSHQVTSLSLQGRQGPTTSEGLQLCASSTRSLVTLSS